MNKLSFLSVGLAMLTLASCSSDEMEQQGMNQPTAINLVSSVGQSTRSANVSLQKVQIASGVEVGVFAKTTTGYITGGDNAKVTADGNGNFTGTTLYFPTDGAAVSVNAYAPYNAAFAGKDGEAVSFSVQADQSSDNGYLKSDLLCGAPTGTNSFTKDNPTVALNFEHKLSKLTVKFTLADNTDVDLKGAAINIVNTLPTTTLKVSDGTLGTASGTATSIKAVTFASDATEFQASAVLVPQTVAAGDFVQVILADKMLNAKLNSAATFASGKSYTYNVNISGSGAETKAEIVLSSTVTDWVEDATELTGDVTEGGTAGGNLLSNVVRGPDCRTERHLREWSLYLDGQHQQPDDHRGVLGWRTGSVQDAGGDYQRHDGRCQLAYGICRGWRLVYAVHWFALL